MNTINGYDEEELTSLPLIIDKMIENKINQTLNTCFIAEVTEVQDNKVSVINTNKYIFGEKTLDYPIITNVLCGTLYIGGFTITTPIQKGDYGICVVSQGDITNFKQTKKISIPNTPRKFDISDSIFIPLQFFNNKNGKDCILQNANTTITINNDSVNIQSQDIVINAISPLKITSQQGSLLDVVDCLIKLTDALGTDLQSVLGTPPPTYTVLKQTMLQIIKGIIK